MRILCVGVLMFCCLTTARADDKDEIAILRALVKSQEKELKELRKQIEQLQDEHIKLLLEKNDALREVLRADITAKLVRAYAVDCEKKVEELTAKIRELTGEKPKLPPDGLRGEVIKLDGDFVQINLGVDAGLEVGTKLDIYRVANGGKYLGTLTVAKANPKNALCKFKPARDVAIDKLRPEELPRKGDSVGNISPNPKP